MFHGRTKTLSFDRAHLRNCSRLDETRMGRQGCGGYSRWHLGARHGQRRRRRRRRRQQEGIPGMTTASKDARNKGRMPECQKFCPPTLKMRLRGEGRWTTLRYRRRESISGICDMSCNPDRDRQTEHPHRVYKGMKSLLLPLHSRKEGMEGMWYMYPMSHLVVSLGSVSTEFCYFYYLAPLPPSYQAAVTNFF